jgi:hypothetical protein
MQEFKKKKPFKKEFKKDFKKKEDEKFDVEKWLKLHPGPEPLKRGKKNTLDKKKKRGH